LVRKENIYFICWYRARVKEAYDNTDSGSEGTMGDYSIPVISGPPIMMCFLFFRRRKENMAN